MRNTDSDARAFPATQDPISYLDTLTAMLGRPYELLQLQRTRLRISKMGVLIPRASTEVVNEFDVHETLGGMPSRICALVTVSKGEIAPLGDLKGQIYMKKL